MTEQRFVGQNIAGMQELEAALRRGEMQLASVRTSTHSIIDMIGSIWRGDVTTAFAMLWRNRHAKAIEAAEESLRTAAETVRRNLEAQMQTSDTLHRASKAGLSSAHTTGPREVSGPDEGGTFEIERRSDFVANGERPAGRGRSALSNMIDRTTGEHLAEDEFGVIDHGNGRYTVVLPGVTDLFPPELGLNDSHRTVRDLDQHAVSSALAPGIASNQYAQMVQEWFERQIDAGEIPEGAQVMLVGHSFGGDTAMDLAASPEFNGGLVDVTHVVSAGYASEHQLDEIPPGTEALVLQNIYDAPTAAESIPHGADGLTESLRNVGRVGVEGAEDAAGGASRFINFIGSGVEGAVDMMPGGTQLDLPDLPTGYTLVSDNRTGPNGSLITEFDGGYGSIWNPTDGFRVGHGQESYTGYLEGDGASNGRLNEYLAAIDRAGYSGTGESYAVDVSVPK